MMNTTGFRTLLAKITTILVIWFFTFLVMNSAPNSALVAQAGAAALLLTGLVAMLLEVDEIPKPSNYTDTEVDRWLEHIEGY